MSLRQHILYEGFDRAAPDAIKDRNGEVCLAQCKVCGLGEAQLDDHPLCAGPHPEETQREAINVGFAEIAVEELGFTEDGPDADTYGLSEQGLADGGRKMLALVEEHFITKAEHDRRVTELLRAVNRENGNRRLLAATLKTWADTFARMKERKVARSLRNVLKAIKR